MIWRIRRETLDLSAPTTTSSCMLAVCWVGIWSASSMMIVILPFNRLLSLAPTCRQSWSWATTVPPWWSSTSVRVLSVSFIFLSALVSLAYLITFRRCSNGYRGIIKHGPREHGGLPDGVDDRSGQSARDVSYSMWHHEVRVHILSRQYGFAIFLITCADVCVKAYFYVVAVSALWESWSSLVWNHWWLCHSGIT